MAQKGGGGGGREKKAGLFLNEWALPSVKK